MEGGTPYRGSGVGNTLLGGGEGGEGGGGGGREIPVFSSPFYEAL